MFDLDTEYCLMFVCENEKIRKQLLRTIEEKLCNAQFIDVFCKMGGVMEVTQYVENIVMVHYAIIL